MASIFAPVTAPRGTAPSCSPRPTSWPWTVLPAVGLATASRRPAAAWCLVRRRGRLQAVGFGVQEASAEEQEEYDKEKADDGG